MLRGESPAAWSPGSHREMPSAPPSKGPPLSPARPPAPQAQKALEMCVRSLVPASGAEMSHLCRGGRGGSGLVQTGPTGGPHWFQIPCVVQMFSPGNVIRIVFQRIVLSELNITYVPFTEENYSLGEKTRSRLLV